MKALRKVLNSWFEPRARSLPTLVSWFDDLLADHNLLPEEGRRAFDFGLEHFTSETTQLLRDYFERIQKTLAESDEPTAVLRSEVMDHVFVAAQSLHAMGLTAEQRSLLLLRLGKASRGHPEDDRFILAMRFAVSTMKYLVLRCYSAAVYGDGAANDWFVYFSEAVSDALDARAGVVEIGGQPGQEILDEMVRACTTSLKEKLLTVPIGTELHYTKTSAAPVRVDPESRP
jgi:hypothetical protein